MRERLSSDIYLGVSVAEDAARTDCSYIVVVVLNEAYEEHGEELGGKYGVSAVIIPLGEEIILKIDLLLMLRQK